MIVLPYADLTYTTDARHQSRHDSDGTAIVASVLDEPDVSNELTFAGDEGSVDSGGAFGTTPLYDYAREIGLRAVAVPDRGTDDHGVGRVRAERIALLARKYENAESVEDMARLEILTQRMRRMAPRVSAEDYDEAARMVDRVEDLTSKLDEMRAKYGI